MNIYFNEVLRVFIFSFFIIFIFFFSRVSSAIDYDPEKKFTLFESGQVRPLAVSKNGKWLFATNTPASRLDIFSIKANRIRLHTSVPVGLEPVAVAVRNNREVWVANHLSDSVSIVRRSKKGWYVANTLLVGDEPRDIVFAQAKGVSKKAYITTAHRGQNVPYDPELTTPGIGRADVWVFEARGAHKSREFGGKPLKILNLFTDTPRALAVSNDGTKVYAAGFLTGNQTAVIPPEFVTNTVGLPSPVTNFEGVIQPEVGLIVKYNGKNWVDELDRIWDDFVYFSLPDKDVFVIDTSTNDPELASDLSFYQNVGTVIFNMAVNPKTGNIFVSNTEARNHERFEGAGVFAGHTIKGNISESRISLLSTSGEVSHRFLNKHIDRTDCCDFIQNETNKKSMAFPTAIEFSKNGRKLYVAALGSSKIGVYETTKLVDDTFVPDTKNQILLNGGGPTGLALDKSGKRLFVMTRFNNSIAIIDTKNNKEIDSIELYNPEPKHVIEGRKFLYDASLTSSTGDIACASCHIFGDNDGLAWDLGNPDASTINNPGPFKLTPKMGGFPEVPVDFFPLKGPMVTQSLRGMDNHGPMHWRGDRTGGNTDVSIQPDQGAFNERVAFEQFNDAFVGLHGRKNVLTKHEMELFTDFVLDIIYPPNPIRNIDNSLTPEQKAGRDFYFDRVSDSFFTCNGCHTLNPQGNAEYGVKYPGFFGTDGSYSFEFESQIMKIPHFRNLYQRVGMFGMPPAFKLRTDNADGTNNHMGDQIRGFGFQHDGIVDTVERFISSIFFQFAEPGSPLSQQGNLGGFSNDPEIGFKERRDVESFLLAFDSNLAPVVGQQATLNQYNLFNSIHRVQLLLSRADKGECDLLVSAIGNIRYHYTEYGAFTNLSDEGDQTLSLIDLIYDILYFGHPITFLCGPPNSSEYLANNKN